MSSIVAVVDLNVDYDDDDIKIKEEANIFSFGSCLNMRQQFQIVILQQVIFIFWSTKDNLGIRTQKIVWISTLDGRVIRIYEYWDKKPHQSFLWAHHNYISAQVWLDFFKNWAYTRTHVQDKYKWSDVASWLRCLLPREQIFLCFFLRGK